MTNDVEARTASHPRRMAWRVLSAGSAGYMIEAYDSAVYGTLLIYLMHAFFGDRPESGAQLLAMAAYAVTFVARPLGSILFGRYADRAGRRQAVAISIVGLGAATLIIGALPAYGQIGAAATALLVIMRLAQGVALGGETGVAPVFVVEHAPASRRGLWGGLVASTGQLGFVLATLVTLLVTTMSHAELTSWGWRLPFLVAGPLALVGLYLRKRTVDAELVSAVKSARAAGDRVEPLREVFRRNWKQVLQLAALLSLNAPLFLILVYLPVYVSGHTSLSGTQVTAVIAIVVTVLVLLYPFAGMAADRIGRRPMLIASGVGTLVLVIPAFALANSGGFWAVLAGGLLLALPLPANFSVIIAAQAELFATDVRATGSGIGYNVGLVLFSGLPPYLASWLVSDTGDRLAPAYMVMAMVILGIAAAVTYPRRRHEVGLGALDADELARAGNGAAGARNAALGTALGPE